MDKMSRCFVRLNNHVVVPQLLSLCSRAPELQPLKPAHPRACAPHKRSHHNEKPVLHNQRVTPHLTATREKPTQQGKPSTAKKKFKYMYFLNCVECG